MHPGSSDNPGAGRTTDLNADWEVANTPTGLIIGGADGHMRSAYLAFLEGYGLDDEDED